MAVGTTNFTGSGQFKFALVNTDGSTTYWSNDGSSTAGSQPATAVTLTVTNGLYSVLLGDTNLANMTAVPFTLFVNSDVRLRVWFSDGINGSQLLTPDQRIASVGYAMIAGSVQDGAITSGMLANGSVGSAQLAANAVQGSNIAAGAVSSTQLAFGLNLAGETTGVFNGALTGNVTGNVSGSAGSFSGSLAGDVTGTQLATVVSKVGTSSAQNVHAAELLANAATSANTVSSIVKRDASGNFSAGTITATLNGNAATSTSAVFAGTASSVTDGAITNSKISAGAVDSTKIAASAVGTEQIADAAVTSTKIATGAVGTEQIADAAMTSTKIAAGAVGTEQIADAAMTSTKIAAGAVGTEQIADGNITAGKLAAKSIGANEVNSTQVQLRVSGTAPGGQFITGINSDGSIISAAAGGGSAGGIPNGMQEFVTNYSFTYAQALSMTGGSTKIMIEVWGAGGGAGAPGILSGYARGGNGGSGGYSRKVITLTSGATYDIVIGNGGTNGIRGVADGTAAAGTSSTFSQNDVILIQSGGGGGGTGGSDSGAIGDDGAGGLGDVTAMISRNGRSNGTAVSGTIDPDNGLLNVLSSGGDAKAIVPGENGYVLITW